MQLHTVVNMFGADLQRRYHEKIHKITLHGGFNCPNRDGTLGRGGCTFCNVSSFADEQTQYHSIEEQIALQAKNINRAHRYLAYFQAYTSTYAEVEYLRTLYETALLQADMVGLCVGTRPDCVPISVLDLLQGYRDQGYEVWLELGLQTAHDKTLKYINRGHDFQCYQATTREARQRGLKVCTHLIVGLPREDHLLNMQTLERVVETGTDGLKLHPLHIVEGSTIAKAWKAGRINALTQEQYVYTAGEMIRHTPPEIIYHRVCASARKPTLLAPEWCENHWLGMNALYQDLLKKGVQGSGIGKAFIPY
ncbi:MULTISPECIES: TIGR01212 family radical SAM protein [Proteus]|uniref:TIGR01212 family radical SAM protein n=1 Tax=Proteus penneri TaxID=102862 RepID=A0ABS0W3R4_9GAMM|nr:MULTISPECIES: TIGR01212 family radical SAM protein [Proteus]MBJ2116614.1 TIGR01212 family radical SAM protein [Proteus penneri]MCO8050911.1 TIGR01212 family radical SAM protein [Proteus penneri]MCX2588383.1 TIGR01212 family radical SAM protein [Proteus penneri]NBL77985.1 TIGR01212 family radical SAM protein [Proteus sp. G2672]NBM51271.1 TIGR01212 family radical SAM protein [Proteus sp. G2666]